MELFILNGIDYTNHITVPSYNVQKEAVEKTWEDATYTMHTDILRWRLKGSFTIYFDSNSELDDFLTNLRNCTSETDNYVDASLYDNLSSTLITSKFKFKISFANNRPYLGTKKHDGYNVTVEER